MKKMFIPLAIMLAMSLSTFAQDAAYSQGSSTISAGYGIGNIYKSLFSLDGGGAVSSTGPFTLTYEYGATDNISVGLALGYSSTSGTSTTVDPNTFTTISETQKLTAFSAVVRANYHFGTSEKFDPYVGIGIGYYNFKYTDSDPNSGNDFSIPGAIGYTAQLGAKYYFVPSFGAFAEVGYVGGSFLQVGLSYNLSGGSSY